MLKDKTKIVDWLEKYKIENYIINDDFTVDVDGSVNINSKNNLTKIPFQFKNISGNFRITSCKLSTLKGCPINVGGYFWCYSNKLTTLDFIPLKIGGDFSCSFNELTSLNGSPNEINGEFDCRGNKLTTLEFTPKIVHGDYNCSTNRLNTFEFIPDVVNGIFKHRFNQLPEHYKGMSLEQIRNYNNNEKLFYSLKESLPINNIKLNTKGIKL